jgi:DNA-directed RNA polymerase beta' subunit
MQSHWLTSDFLTHSKAYPQLQKTSSTPIIIEETESTVQNHVNMLLENERYTSIVFPDGTIRILDEDEHVIEFSKRCISTKD